MIRVIIFVTRKGRFYELKFFFTKGYGEVGVVLNKTSLFLLRTCRTCLQLLKNLVFQRFFAYSKKWCVKRGTQHCVIL